MGFRLQEARGRREKERILHKRVHRGDAVTHRCAPGLHRTKPRRPPDPCPSQEAIGASFHSQPLWQRTFLSFEDHRLRGQEVYLAI